MNKKNDSSLLWKYAGLATQFLVGIGIAVYAGKKLDESLLTGMPLAVWVLPLLLIVAVIYKIIKDTAPKK